MPSRSRALAVSDPRRLTGSLLGPHGGARTLIPAMRRIVRLCSLVLNTNLRSRAVGARAFLARRPIYGLGGLRRPGLRAPVSAVR